MGIVYMAMYAFLVLMSPGFVVKIKLIFILWLVCLTARSIMEKGQRLVGSESGYCVGVGRHVYPWTVVSVS
jgi:hypothetical protein